MRVRPAIAQWLPGYQLDIEELRSITASFLEAFPDTALWRNDFHAAQPIICLVGYRDGFHLDFSALEAGCGRLESLPMALGGWVRDPLAVAMLYVGGGSFFF